MNQKKNAADRAMEAAANRTNPEKDEMSGRAPAKAAEEKQQAPMADLYRCRRQLQQLLAELQGLTGQTLTPDEATDGQEPCDCETEEGFGLLQDPEWIEDRMKTARYRQLAHLYVMEHDLRRIQKAFPKEKIESIDQLGEPFFALRRSGIDPVVACAALLQSRGQQQTPPEMGLLSGRHQPAQEYYTPAEVDRLTEKELRDPGVMAAVRWSMTKWKNR